MLSLSRGASSRVLSLACSLTLVGVYLAATAPAALAGDFVDTRISFVFSDDNVLAGPGETFVNSPQADFGPRDGLFFPFENLNSKDDIDTTAGHFVVYKEMGGPWDFLVTDAALVGRLQVLSEPETNFAAGDIDLSDAGSYLRARFALGVPFDFDEKKKLTNDAERQLEMTFFPINSDRFRAGYTYDLSWGGTRIFANRKSSFATPGMRMRLDWDDFYFLVGAKTTRLLILDEDPTIVSNRELGGFWGGIAGTGYVHDNFGVEVNGGLFEAGRIPKQGLQGETVWSGGVSARISAYSEGMKPEQSIDYRLYRNNAEAFTESNSFLRKPKNYDEFTWRASAEFNALMQTLGDYDKPRSTTMVNAFAGAVRGDIYIEKLAINVDFVMRQLNAILFNVPSLDPYLSLPKDSDETPELLAAIKVEYWLESLNLIPGILFGIQSPASYRGRTSETPHAGELAAGVQTVVVPNANTIIPFPSGGEPSLVYSVRGTLRWDLSDMMSMIGQITYSRDANQLGRRRDEATQTYEYYFRDPNVLGFSFFVQSRF
ncbi:MAG: hypothetical protein RBU37_19575 [Myxococcota bacterium]|jgi:hypothetical protein|nr:hypothetical protein [Myxococcota bacterium]